MRLKLQKIVFPIFIALIPLLLFWRLVFAGEVLYWGLPLYQFYPWHTLVVEAIRAGHLPLWTDLLGNGAPLLANHQSATFYPLNLIYFLIPVEQAMGYSVVLHLILAGLFAYAWGQTIGLSRFGAMAVGLSFMLSGFFVSRTQFITIINGASWLPLLFLLAERLTRRRTLLDAIWLGVALALQFLAGHAQLWFYSLWVVVAYVLTRAWFVSRERPGNGDSGLGLAWPQRRHVFTLMAVAFILSLGLSAVQLLPTAELSLHSQRVDGLDPDDAMIYSFWPWRLLTLPVPDLFGSPATGDYWGYATYWEDAGYVGVLPLLLVLNLVLSTAIGVVWGRGRRWLSALAQLPPSLIRFRKSITSRVYPYSPSKIREPIPLRTLSGRAKGAAFPEPEVQKANDGPRDFLTIFFLLLILISLILAMGRYTPVFPVVFEYVPGFAAFRAPARFLLFFTFGVSTLAGMGADRFRLSFRTQYVARLTVAGAGAMLVVSLAAGQMGWATKPTFAPAVARFALWLGLSAILLMLCPARAGLCPARAGGQRQRWDDSDSKVVRSPLSLKVWQGLILSLIAADLILFAAPLTPTIAPILYRTMTDADRFMLARANHERLFATYDYDYNTKFDSYFDFSDWGSPDLAHWLSFREALVPNLNVFSRTPSVNNDDPLVVGRWRELMDALRSADWPDRLRLLRMMNVGYVLADSPPPGLWPMENVPHLYRISEPLTYAWVVSDARIIPSPDDILSELMADTFDPATEVLLESNHPSPGQSGDLDLETGVHPLTHALSTPARPSQGPHVAASLREERNGRTIDLVMSQPGYLVLAYTFYPGWRATVDGRPTEILRANYAFMALPLETGEHQVMLRYQPVSLILGALISGLSVLVVGMAVLRSVSKSASEAR